METQKVTISVPRVLQELIRSNNMLLQRYQQELSQVVMNSNQELMHILGLNPDEGWSLDIDNMVYIKKEHTTE